MATERKPGGRGILVGLGLELSYIAAQLAEVSKAEAAPYAGPPSAAEVAELIEAREARSILFALDLADPGWTLLLHLFHAHLEGRPLRWAGLAGETQLDRLCLAGLARRHRETAVLTDFAAEAMSRQLEAEKLALLLG